MKRRMLVALLLLAAFLPLRAEAAAAVSANYCAPVYVAERCISLFAYLDNVVMRLFVGLGVGLAQGVATLFWVWDRVAATVFEYTVSDPSWLENVRLQMLRALGQVMPGLLRRMAFSPQGLMYIALALAGIFMIAPLAAAQQRFVRAERVLIWGALLSALFVSGSFGYDFIGALENFRQGIVREILSGTHMPTDRLILQPMMAGSGDLAIAEANFTTLPPTFAAIYFPQAQMMEVTIAEGGFLGLGNALIEAPQQMNERVGKAWLGVFMALVSAFGAALLFLVGLTYVLLSFAALALIIFLMAALPLGFFEIGGAILWQIAGRYVNIFIQAVALAVFLRLLGDWLGFLLDVNSVWRAILWLVVMVILLYIVSTFLNGALRQLMQTGGVVRSTAQAISGTYGGESLGQLALSGAAKAAGGAAALVGTAALLSGRTETALAAGLAAQASRTVAQRSRGAFLDAFETTPVGETGAPRGNIFANNGSGALSEALIGGALVRASRLQTGAGQENQPGAAAVGVSPQLQQATQAARLRAGQTAQRVETQPGIAAGGASPQLQQAEGQPGAATGGASPQLPQAEGQPGAAAGGASPQLQQATQAARLRRPPERGK
jgi:hypothetical protein